MTPAPASPAEIRFHEVLRSFGLYRSIFNSAVVFCSIVFRLILGVTSQVSPIAIALVPAIEFSLNAFLEVPGGRLADRYGRVFIALIGLSLIASGLLSAFAAVLFSAQTSLSLGLLVIDGICLGIGRALLSGSIEAFYQHLLQQESDNLGSAKAGLLEQSFTASHFYGRYFTSIAILASFAVIVLMQKTIGGHYALLIGAALFTSLIWRVYRDAIRFGGPGSLRRKTAEVSHFRSCLQIFIDQPLALLGVVLLTLYYSVHFVMGGFFMVSLGRILKVTAPDYLYLGTGAFILGYSGLGWILKATLLPRLLRRLREFRYLALICSVIFVAGVIFHQALPKLQNLNLIFASVIFGIVVQLMTGALQDVGSNLVLSQFKKSDYATALSLANIPSFLCAGAYSAYMAVYAQGAPSLAGIARVVVISAGIALVTISLNRQWR